MPHYLYAYHGGSKPSDPEEGEKFMQKWQAWATNLGNAVINPGVPLGKSYTVSTTGIKNDGGANPLSGFSIIEADNNETALEIAKTCPFLEVGTIEVAEMHEM